jgi:hypothetical protein
MRRNPMRDPPHIPRGGTRPSAVRPRTAHTPPRMPSESSRRLLATLKVKHPRRVRQVHQDLITGILLTAADAAVPDLPLAVSAGWVWIAGIAAGQL